MSLRPAALLLLLSCLTKAQPYEPRQSYSIHLNQTHHLEGKTLIDPREDSPALVFGYCHEGRCTFFRERESSVNRFDASSHLLSCRFNFDAGEVLELYPFGSDKIVFMYEVQENKRFGILNLSSCRVLIAQTKDTMMYARVMVTDEDRFEIAVDNYGEAATMCRERECKMTISREGYDIGREGLHEWIERADYRSVAYSIERGYVVVDGDVATKSLLAYTVDDEDETVLLTNLTSHLIPPVSTTHQLVTTCGTDEHSLTCVQFDRSGQQKFETAIRYSNVVQAKLHNLPRGGFLLLTSKCPKTVGHCDEPNSQFRVTKVDATGKIDGRFEVTEFSYDLYFDLNRVYLFFKDNGKELCFSSVYKKYLRRNDEQVVEIFCRLNEFDQ